MNPNLQQALQLRDIHLPAAPGWWPPAPGWWILAAMALALLAWLTVFGMRRMRVRRRRRRILAMLGRLEADLARQPSPQVLAQLSVLLRRLALSRFPQRDVAALTGKAWLQFLDESGGKGRFAQGPGRVLAAGPYQAQAPADLDAPRLVALAREWIELNTKSAA